MLSRLFGRKSTPDPVPSIQMCMVGLKSPVSASAVKEAWNTLFPSSLCGAVDTSKEGTMTFHCEGQSVTMVAIPAPIPAPEIEAAAEASFMWPDAKEAMKAMRAHAILASIQDQKPTHESAVQLAVLNTRLAAALCSCGSAVGVYWGSAALLHEPEAFAEFASTLLEDGTLPVMLWINIMVGAKGPKGPFNLSTHGMGSFGHKEFEILGSTMPPNDLRMMIMDVIGYVLENGPVLKHGETFGPDEDTEWSVEHTTSTITKGLPVIRLGVQ